MMPPDYTWQRPFPELYFQNACQRPSSPGRSRTFGNIWIAAVAGDPVGFVVVAAEKLSVVAAAASDLFVTTRPTGYFVVVAVVAADL